MMPLIMMRMSNPLFQDRQRAGHRALVIQRLLTEYFQMERDGGRLVDIDPRIAARIWLGSIRHAVMFETLGSTDDDLTTDVFIAGLVDLFCKQPSKPRTK
jgi:hypothetical protein